MTKLEVKNLFGKNYLGIEELSPFFKRLGLDLDGIIEPDINFTDTDLIISANDGYILLYGIGIVDDKEISLNFLRDIFGVNPDESEPCLYNQDWYMKEEFMNVCLKNQWYLIKKNVLEDSRSVMPVELMDKGIVFPPAILCAYAFFSYYYANNTYLWYHDFIWCQDVDHNGDRIYVGKYNDIEGVNKNGFSIHRHLSLRPCYASVLFK